MGANCDVCGLPYPLEDLEEWEIPDERIVDVLSIVIICSKCRSFLKRKLCGEKDGKQK